LQRILRGIDAVVVPSLWYESNPNVLPEAFALKKPVIASNLGSLPEAVVHDGNGLLFRAGDADSLAVQLQRLLDEPDLLATLRSGIRPPRRLAEEVDDIEAIYRALQLPSFRHGA
jgi:glycosyltransferase involved in cell wall biosynthesis